MLLNVEQFERQQYPLRSPVRKRRKQGLGLFSASNWSLPGRSCGPVVVCQFSMLLGVGMSCIYLYTFYIYNVYFYLNKTVCAWQPVCLEIFTQILSGVDLSICITIFVEIYTFIKKIIVVCL